MNIIQKAAGNILNRTMQIVTGKSLRDDFMRGGDGSVRSDGLVSLSEADYLDAFCDSAWIYACVSRIQSDIAALNLVIKDSKKEIVELHPALALMQKPCDFMTAYDFKEFMVGSLELSGNFYASADKYNPTTFEPQSFFPFMPAAVTAIASKVKGKIIDHYEYNQVGGKIDIDLLLMLHLKYYNPKADGYLKGLSPLSAASMAYQTDKQSVIWNMNSISNGTALDVVLESDKDIADPNQRKEMIDSFTQKYSGARNARKPALLANGVKAKSLSLSPKDVEFLNGRKFTREEGCMIYRVPPALVGIFEYANYANSEQQEKFYWKNGIKPRCVKIASMLTFMLLRRFKKSEGLYFEHDLSEVAALQEDELGKIKTAREYMSCGVPYNQIAKEMNLKVKEIAGGDVGYIPFSLQRVDQVGSGDNPPADPNAGKGAHKDCKHFACKGGLTSAQMSIKWKSFVALAASFEERFVPALQSFFRGQQLEVESNLGAEKSVKIDISKILFDMTGANADFVAKAKPIMRQIIKDQAALEIDNFNFGISFDLEDPKVVDWIQQRGLESAAEINDTTKTKLKDTLSQGIEAGESIPDLAKRISAVYDEAKGSRAEKIARTETIAASNQANLETYRQVEAQTGAKIKKAWLSAEDERTRESHIKAGENYSQDKPIGTEEDFYVGAGHGSAPAQIGRPEEDINCRCSVMPVIEG
jgi:HK97 family phage portal protein